MQPKYGLASVWWKLWRTEQRPWTEIFFKTDRPKIICIDIWYLHTVVIGDPIFTIFYVIKLNCISFPPGSFYLCRTSQNINSKTRKLKIQWLSLQTKPDIYVFDYADTTEMETVITEIVMDKVSFMSRSWFFSLFISYSLSLPSSNLSLICLSLASSKNANLM